MSGFLIVPMDRLGVTGVQGNAMEAIKEMNSLMASGQQVSWLIRDTKLVTADFPEGHVYSAGGFVVTGDDEVQERLTAKGIIHSALKDEPANNADLRPKNIGLYVGQGTAEFCWQPLMEVLDLAGFSYKSIDDNDIRQGLLSDFDIFLVPGGPDAGESYYCGLGDAGYGKLKEYIMSQGNYFGICAGAYLPLTSVYKDNRYWLNLIAATDDEDLDYWRTGTGFVKIRITEPSHPFAFGLAAGGVNTLDCVYWEGPAMRVLDDNVKILATYDDFVASGTRTDLPRWDLLDNEPAKEALNSWYNVLTRDRFDRYLRDAAAVVETKINNNKMLLYSPHAEFGNIGITNRRDSRIFQLITNGLFYLSI